MSASLAGSLIFVELAFIVPVMSGNTASWPSDGASIFTQTSFQRFTNAFAPLPLVTQTNAAANLNKRDVG